MLRKTIALLTLNCLVALAYAQEAPKPAVDHSYKPLTLKLSEDGSKYIRFITWHQFWTSWTDNNPGTVDVNGNASSSSFSIGLRRSRMLMLAQVSPRFLILTHFGINNQSFVNGGATGTAYGNNGGKKPQLYLHDAWAEYTVVPDKLYIGTGLHYWNGVSRLASASTLNFMGLDNPISAWFTIEGNDQFARQLGIYAKGQFKKFDYRFAFNKPFTFGVKPTDVTSANATATLTEKMSFAGYVNYQFFDTESNKLPFFVGSHLGAKKVLNLGAGYYIHPEATGSREIVPVDSVTNDTNFIKHDTKLFGADIFADIPLNKENGMYFTGYGGVYLYDFGPNYLRNIGVLNTNPNPTVNSESLAGSGNLQPMIGTGTIIFAHAGIGLPKFKNGTQLQPYVEYTYKKFDRLQDASSQVNAGVTYYILNHNARLTLEYGTRPVYRTDGTLNGSKGQLTLQAQIFL